MPVLDAITWSLNARCVHWVATGEYDNFGKALYTTPVEIDCRWDDEQVEFLNMAGETVKSKAVVTVDRKITKGFLANALLSEMTNPTDPLDNEGWEVEGFRITPSFDGDEALYEVFV